MDIWSLVNAFVDVKVAIAAAFVSFMYQRYVLPSPDGGPAYINFPGTWGSRLHPVVAPTFALLASLSIQWTTAHKITPGDVVAGINSGVAAEYLLRFVFKTWLGK